MELRSNTHGCELMSKVGLKYYISMIMFYCRYWCILFGKFNIWYYPQKNFTTQWEFNSFRRYYSHAYTITYKFGHYYYTVDIRISRITQTVFCLPPKSMLIMRRSIVCGLPRRFKILKPWSYGPTHTSPTLILLDGDDKQWLVADLEGFIEKNTCFFCTCTLVLVTREWNIHNKDKCKL